LLLGSEPHSPSPVSPLSEQSLGPGRLRLKLGSSEALDCGRLCELTVDIEGRPGESLLHRRGRVRSAVIEVHEALLGRIVTTHLHQLTARLPPGLPRADRLALRFLGAVDRPQLLVVARFPDAGALPVWCSLRVPLGPGRQDFRGPRRSSEPLALGMNLLDGEVRVYGASRVASSLLALAATLCVGAGLLTFRHASTEPAVLPSTEFAPGPGLRLLLAHGLREVGVDLLWDALLQVLPRHGYRAADAQSAALALVEVSAGTLRLTYEGLVGAVDFDDDPRGRSTVDGGQIESLLLADRLLIEGDVPAALSAYRLFGSVESLAEAATLRRAQILSTAPSRAAEAVRLIDRLAQTRPWDKGTQLLALGLRGHRPDSDGAMALASLAKSDGQLVEERVLLLLWAAQLHADEAQAVSLASAALEHCSGNDSSPTVALVADEAVALLQVLSSRLLTDASAEPPAVERGEVSTELLLGDRSFLAGEVAAAAVHYRRALAADRVPRAEKAQVHMRLAEAAHHHSDFATEEAELCLAVEAGGGAAAWSALAALFQSLGDGARLGVALYAWSQHEVDEARVDLLRQAARHVGPSLLLAIDEALLSLGADDESVRERLLLRRRQSDDRPGTLSLLIRDMAQSTGARRWASAKLAAETARLLGDAATEAEAVLVSLSAPPSASDEEALRATGLLAAETAERIPTELLTALRSKLRERGSLRTVLRRLDQRLALLASAAADSGAMRQLLRQSAICLTLLDEHAAAAARWLRAASLGDRAALTETRRLLGRLLTAGQHEQARRLVDGELRRCAPEHTAPLRVALAEVLLRSGRPSEALGQIELALLRDEELPAAHALLGQLLYGLAQQPAERARALRHLLLATESPELSRREAGECALLAARLLLSSGGSEPDETLLTLGLLMPQTAEVSAQAVRLLERATELLERDPRPLRLLIRHHAVHSPERALPLCDVLLDLATTAEERAAALWQKSQLVGDAGQAVALLHESLGHDPDFLPALSSLRLRTESSGDKTAALGWLSREIAASPSDGERAELLCKQAELLHPQSQAELIATTLRKAMQLGSGRAAQRLGELHFSRGELLQAADVAGRAAQLLPRSEQGRQLLVAAEWAQRVGDELRAREYLRQATELVDESAKEAEQRLIVLDGGDDPISRRRTLETRLLQSTTGLANIESLRQLLVLCARQGDLAAVERYAQALLAQVPLDPLGQTALADCLIVAGRAPDTIFAQLHVCADYPRRAMVLAAQADWLIKRGELATAEPLLSEALRSTESLDDRQQLSERLSWLQAERGDHAKAAHTLAAMLPDASDPAARLELHLRTARLYEQAGLLMAAAEQLRALLRERPGQLSALQRLYAVSLGSGEVREARSCLDQLVAQAAGSERARWLCRRAELHASLGRSGDALSDAEASLADAKEPELLRALLLLGVQVSDGGLIRQATTALQAQRAPLLGASALAGWGLLLHAACPPEQAERLIQGTDDPAELAAVVSQAVASFPGPLGDLDRVLEPLSRLLGSRFAQLHLQLTTRAFFEAVDVGAVKLLSRLSEALHPPLHAVYLSALAFLDPLGEAAQRLDRLPTMRVSPSDERLPQPSDELRPLTTLLSHLARVLLPESGSLPGADGPLSRVRDRQVQLFVRMGGELVSDLADLRALVGAAVALWLPGREPQDEAEQKWLRSLQARALRPGLPSLTTEQAHLLLDPVWHELAQAPQEQARLLTAVRELLWRRALLIAAVEQPDLRPALLSLLPSPLSAPVGVGAGVGAGVVEAEGTDTLGSTSLLRQRLGLLSRPPLLTLLGDAQRLLS
jgi:predicted Zn-dependent protease